MRLRVMATYLGVPYQAGLGPDGNQVTLFSPGPPPEELGFVAGPGHWRKQVNVSDLGALWQSRPVGEYRGEPCLVLDDFGDRLHIAYLGRDTVQAAQLGYWEIDREVFEVVVARHDVTGLIEERVDFPLTAAAFPPSGSSGPDGGSAPGTPASPQAAAVAEPAVRPGPAGLPDPAAVSGNGGGAAGAYARGTAGYADGGPGKGGGATGNGRPEGFGGSDHPSRMPDRVAAWHGSPAPEPWPARDPGRAAPAEPQADNEPQAGHDPWAGSQPRSQPGAGPGTAPAPGRRTGRKDRIAPESVFAELLNLAAIPQGAYAVDEEVPGAMCLVEADGGFEVFSRTDDARLEVRFFEDEEAAYFYLFGVLAAEAIRSGRLAPSDPDRANGNHNGTARPGTSASTENVSKYLRGGKLPKSTSRAAMVY